MTASLAESRLARDGLSANQLRHFADHGWVVLDSVLDEDTCGRYRDAIEYTVNRLKHSTAEAATHRAFVQAHLYHPLFIDLYGTPGLIPALRQLIGVREPRLLDARAVTDAPHPGRQGREDELRDPLTWGWHRDFRPRWNILPHESDPRLINSLVVTVAFYFTPPSPDRGATALLDGSHRHEGPYGIELYKQLRDSCEIVQPSAGAGTIVIFSESLLHSTTRVLADEPRYASFAFFGPPWFGGDAELQPPFQPDRMLDAEIAALFAPSVGDMQHEFD
jgi:Phytanoyl-CoA dioxygenase (PhyH)